MADTKAEEIVFQDGHPIDSDGPFIVVGANGFLGSEICLHLRRRNRWAKIVAPLRRNSSVMNPRLEGINVEWIQCESVVDRDVMQRCLDAASTQHHTGIHRKHVAGVFYTAGLTLYSTDEEDIAAMYDANVRLPNMVLQFCTDFNVRTVFCSCSHVVGCQFRDQGDWIAHDDTERCQASIEGFPFLQQRRDVELHWHQEALKGRSPIVFVRPSLLLGPGDERVRSTYALLELISGIGPVAIRYGGGISFVDVRDVASAMLQCMFGHIRGGTLMNLNAANLPLEEFVDLVEKTLRLSCTSWIPYRSTPRIPAPILRAVAHGVTRVRAALGMPFDERYSPVYIESKLRFYNVSCQRAKAAIRWDPRDLEETIQDTAKHLVRLLQHNEVATAAGGDIRVMHKNKGVGRTRSMIVGFDAAIEIAASSWRNRKPPASPQRHGGALAGTQRTFIRRVVLVALLIALVLCGVLL
jgi:dihydroflavonol-4-reductase